MVNYNPLGGRSVQINNDNIDFIIESNEVVVIMFYDKHCRFFSTYGPMLEEAATRVSRLYPDFGRVVLGKADCDVEKSFSTRFKVDKLKIKSFINGKQPFKNDFSNTSVKDLVSYVKLQIEGPIQDLSTLPVTNIFTNVKGNVIIGYFENKESPEYLILKKVSMNLMDVCRCFAGFGEAYKPLYPHVKSLIMFKCPNQVHEDNNIERFKGTLDYESLNTWATRNCFQSTQEITYENAQNILKETSTNLILFYDSKNLKPIKQFKEIIKTDFDDWRGLKFLTANGATFKDRLNRIGYRQEDLPFIFLDKNSFIYQFPFNIDFTAHHKLKTFVYDSLSNKENRPRPKCRIKLFNKTCKTIHLYVYKEDQI